MMYIIEVQTGDYLGEDDIERLEDKYGEFNSHNLLIKNQVRKIYEGANNGITVKMVLILLNSSSRKGMKFMALKEDLLL